MVSKSRSGEHVGSDSLQSPTGRGTHDADRRRSGCSRTAPSHPVRDHRHGGPHLPAGGHRPPGPGPAAPQRGGPLAPYDTATRTVRRTRRIRCRERRLRRRRHRPRRQGRPGGVASGRTVPGRRGPAGLHLRHRHRHPLHRRPAGRPSRPATGRHPAPPVRPGLCRRRRRPVPCARLPAGPARRRGGAALGRTVLAHLPARRRLDGQPGRHRTVRRRRRRGRRLRREPSAPPGRDRRPDDRGHAQPPVPGHRARHGLGHQGHRLPDRPRPAGPRRRTPLSRRRRRGFSRRPRDQEEGRDRLGVPPRRPQGPSGRRRSPRPARRRTGRDLASPRRRRQPVLVVGAPRTARHPRRTPPAAGHPGVLLAMGPGFACELVLLRW